MADGTHVDLGHAMITMVEPTRDPDRLHEYNRWYEHDHALSGVMVGPWAFSYGRFVATRDLKPLRRADRPTVADPLELGTFIAFYWYLDGKVEEHFAWSFPATQELTAQGRMNPDRDHVSTSLYDFRGSVNRDGWPVPAEVALDHRYDGLVVTWLDRTDAATVDDVVAWALESWLPTVLTGAGPVAQGLVFTPRDFPGVPGTGVGVGEKVLVAWFLHDDPRDAWTEVVGALTAPLQATEVATLGLLAPFIPVVPGTPTYLDELW